MVIKSSWVVHLNFCLSFIEYSLAFLLFHCLLIDFNTLPETIIGTEFLFSTAVIKLFNPKSIDKYSSLFNFDFLADFMYIISIS